MATAYLIHGYLGAGKTTFARQLAVHSRAIRYSPDEWITRIYGANPPEENFNSYVDAVYDVVNSHWPQLLALDVNVVLDFGFWKRSSRDAARQQALAAGASVKLFYVSCDPGIAKTRCLARNTKLEGSFVITATTFEALKSQFQPLDPDEPFSLVDTEARGADQSLTAGISI